MGVLQASFKEFFGGLFQEEVVHGNCSRRLCWTDTSEQELVTFLGGSSDTKLSHVKGSVKVAC